MTRIPGRLSTLSVAVLVFCSGAAAPSPAGTIPTACLMLEPVKWDKDANAQRLDAAIRLARERGARLVVTPEGALEGYVENEVIRATGPARRELTDRFNRLAEPADGPHVQRFQRLCGELGVYLVLGFLEADAGKTYNTAILISPEGKTVGRYRKTHFAQGYRVGDEKGDNPPGYTRGHEYPVFPVDSAKVGIMICFDRRVPEVARRLVENGADLIVNPSYGRQGDCNRQYVSARAKENRVPILFVHPAQTVFCTPEGEVKLDIRPRKEDDRIHVVSMNVPMRHEPARP